MGSRPREHVIRSFDAMQGLPLGSGMGSSAASAAAGAWAVNSLFGGPLSKQELVPAGLASEAIVSGYHADNIAPALLGGFVLIRWGALHHEPASLSEIILRKSAFDDSLSKNCDKKALC